MLPHLANFVFLVETGFYFIGQSGLEFLASSDLRASASQSAGITGVSHHDQLKVSISSKFLGDNYDGQEWQSGNNCSGRFYL